MTIRERVLRFARECSGFYFLVREVRDKAEQERVSTGALGRDIAKLATGLEALQGEFAKLNASLQASHVIERPRFVQPSYDWETVQLMQLENMEREPNKEN